MGKAIPWTDEEINILEEGYKNHENTKVIAEKIGKSVDSIRSMASKLKLSAKYPRFKKDYNKKKKFWTQEEIKILENGYKNFDSVKTIAEKLPGRTEDAIKTKAERLGYSDLYIRYNNQNFKAEYQNYDWLYERFIQRCMSTQEIAEESGYSKRVLEKWIHEKHHLDYKKDFRLNDVQKMIVVSGCLGDGHISKDHGVYVESHAENQKDYMYWKYNILKNMCNLLEPTYYPPKMKVFNDKEYLCQATYRVTTRDIDDLNSIREMTRSEKINYLDGLGFSTHFLDDGSYNGCNWEICLAEWTKEEKDLYMKRLSDLFGVISWYQKDTRYIILDKESSDIMNKEILKHIPNNLDIICYKILKYKEAA